MNKKITETLRQATTTLLMLLISVFLFAQAEQDTYQPYVGQQGKDVVWVPTPQALVDQMLNMAKLTPEDFVIDLGSGDGRTVITAAKQGARALGIEYNPEMVALSKLAAEKEGVSSRAEFMEADIFESDFSKATIITMFLLPDINLRLRPKILDLKPGTRIVSNTFTMQDWEADQTVTLEEDCSGWCTALLWIVPAKVDGSWKMNEGTLTFDQEFQFFDGSLTLGSNNLAIRDGKLNGTEISFTAGSAIYTGTVNGNTMSGTVNINGQSSKWSASRIQ